MNEDPRYMQARLHHQRWARARWRIVVFPVLGRAVITNLFQLEAGSAGLGFAIFGAAATAVILGRIYGHILCPRCSRPFYSRTFFNNALATHCLHCGLSKDATHDPGNL